MKLTDFKADSMGPVNNLTHRFCLQETIYTRFTYDTIVSYPINNNCENLSSLLSVEAKN